MSIRRENVSVSLRYQRIRDTIAWVCGHENASNQSDRINRRQDND